MKNDQSEVTQVNLPLGKTTTVNNPNGRDADVTLSFSSGTSVTFFLPANGSFSLISHGDVLDLQLAYRPRLPGPAVTG